MARASSVQARVNGAALVRALHAAAAYVHADKKSHRHRLNLRTVGQDDTMSLVVAGGSPTRAITVNAGKATGDELAVDLSPAAAGLIAKVFAGSGDVALKYDGKTLACSAQDQLFDNQRIEVRALPHDKRADSVQVVALAADLATNVVNGTISLTADDAVTIAKAAKAIGITHTVEPVQVGFVAGAAVTYGAAALAYVRARVVETPALPMLFETMVDEYTVGEGSPWLADHIHLGHVLDGVAPLSVVKPGTVAGDDEPTDEPADGDTGVDLDQTDDDVDPGDVEEPPSLAAVLADDDTATGDAA